MRNRMKQIIVGSLCFTLSGILYLVYLVPAFLDMSNESIHPDIFLLIGFFPIGGIFGYIFPKHWAAIPSVAFFLLVAISIFEDVLGIRSHNLIGIELALYLYCCFTGVIGMIFGKYLKIYVIRNRPNKSPQADA